MCWGSWGTPHPRSSYSTHSLWVFSFPLSFNLLHFCWWLLSLHLQLSTVCWKSAQIQLVLNWSHYLLPNQLLFWDALPRLVALPPAHHQSWKPGSHRWLFPIPFSKSQPEDLEAGAGSESGPGWAIKMQRREQREIGKTALERSWNQGMETKEAVQRKTSRVLDDGRHLRETRSPETQRISNCDIHASRETRQQSATAPITFTYFLFSVSLAVCFPHLPVD